MSFESVDKALPINWNSWTNALRLWLDPNWKKKGLLDPESLEFKHLEPSSMQQKPYFIAIDTETYASNGNLICLCNSENNKVLRGYPDKLPSIVEVFNYLRNCINYKNTYFLAYNLKFDASVILKCMDKDILEKFYYGIDDQKFIIKHEGIEITYLHKKCLTMKKGSHTVKIYDALQYFIGAGEGGKSNLDSVAKAYLGDQKEYTGKYQNKSFPDTLDKEPEELKQVIEYCIKDCILTKKLMDIWIDSFYKNFGFYPTAYYSAGYISSQYLKTQLYDFTCFRKVPFTVQNLAYNSYFGGRFEITQRGRLKNIYHYDINSAYPYAMSKLPDFNNGKWRKIDSIEEYSKYSKNVGFYKVKVDVQEKDLSPFMFRNIYGQIIAPRGEFTTTITSFELEKAIKYYDFKLKRISGFTFIPTKNNKSEFNKLVEGMYKARLKQTNQGQKYVYKVLINSLYGKFAQAKPKPKNLFNPVMCSAITGFCRGMLLDSAKDNKSDIVMFATDGVFSTKKLNLNTPKEKILGAWEGSFHPDFILIMAGIYSFNSSENKKMNTHSRGFGLRVFDEKRKEFHFDLEDYKLKLKDKKYVYELYNMRPVAISQAVIQKAYSKNDISKMHYVEKNIDINGDRKRLWLDYLRDIDSHNYSQTIRL